MQIVITAIVSAALGFIAGALVFRKNAATIEAQIEEARRKRDAVREVLKK